VAGTGGMSATGGASGTGGSAGSAGSSGIGGGRGSGGGSGTGGAAGAGGAGGNAGAGGAGGNAGAGGAGGNAGAGGTSCLQFLTTSAEITTATQGLTMTQADLAHDANGNAFTGGEQLVSGDNFATHASVTFVSVDTSNQAPVGQTINVVAETPGSPAVIASDSPATSTDDAGFDGIESIFAAAQTAAIVSGAIGSGVPQDSFTLVVHRSDTSGTTMFTVPTTGSFTAGVNSICGSIVTELDVLPGALSGTGNHMSTYWSMTGLSFGH
jgi:hypothetical protein